jgi:uncharacterized cupin superfamily protein
MRKVHINDVVEDGGTSPKGKFGGYAKEISLALGRDPISSDYDKRHPFDVELSRLTPGQTACPYHSHSAQWEFYIIVSGSGSMRDEDGVHAITAGDSILYKPNEAHSIVNDGNQDLIFYTIADNPFGDHCYYPDSKKWLVRIPERTLIRSEALDYFDGEE